MDFQCNITGLITRVSLGTDTRMRTHTQRTEREDEGRDRGWGVQLQARAPEIASKPAEARGPAGKRSPLTAFRRSQHC